MFDRILQRLEHFLSPTSEASSSGIAGGLMQNARALAWQMRHAELAPEHVLWWLLRMVDARRALQREGVSVDDAFAALEEWMADLPTTTVDAAPPSAENLERAIARVRADAVARGRAAIRTDALVAEVAAVLPPAFNFLRAPLVKVAPELGRLFDAPIAAKGDVGTGNVQLTLEGWDPKLKFAIGLMQHLTDTKFAEAWWMNPWLLFFSLLITPDYKKAFEARGIDVAALIREMTASMPPPPKWGRPKPAGVQAGLAPTLVALFVRAERYAAEDATDVRLRHVLAALHDEKDIAPWVERIAA